MDEITALPIEQLVRRLQQHDLSRSRFMTILGGSLFQCLWPLLLLGFFLLRYQTSAPGLI